MSGEEESLDLLLIQPPAFGEFSPPLGLASLVGFLRKDQLKVKAIDYNIKFFNQAGNPHRSAWKFSKALSSWNDIPVYEGSIKPHFQDFSKRVVRDILFYKPSFVGLSILETSVQTSFDLIRTIREFFGNDIRIIVGGPEINKLRAQDYLFNHGVFCAFFGEAELGLQKLLQEDRKGSLSLRDINGIYFLENGLVQETFPAMVKDLDSLPFPDFSDFDLDEYAFRERILPIATSRGCIAKCSFCGETNFMDRFRQLSAGRIVSEIQNGITKYDAKVFRLNDSLINGKLKVLEGWVDELLLNDVQIVFGAAQARIDGRMSEELFLKLQKAGCQIIQYGVETGSNRLLKIMKKGIKFKEICEVVKRTHAAGITVQINLIVGHFEETFMDYLKTLMLVFQTRKHVKVIAVNLYAFDKLSADTANAKGIIDPFSERWGTNSISNHYYVRLAKRSVILFIMRMTGIRYP